MRSFITAMIIAAVTAAGAGIHSAMLSQFTQKLSRMNSDARELITRGDSEAAAQKAAQMSGYVQSARTFLSVTGSHSDAESIEKYLAGLCVYASCGNTADACASCAALDVNIRHISDKYSLKWENIF